MIWQGLAALAYGSALAALGWKARGIAALRVPATGGIAFGGLAALGGLLLLLGQPAGRGLALLAAVVVFLAVGWTLSQGLLLRQPVGRAVAVMTASGLVGALLVLGGCAGSPPASAPADSPAPAAGPREEAPLLGIEEPSGVCRRGDLLLVVGDEEPGTWYSLPVPDPVGPVIPLAPASLTRHRLLRTADASDLEAIGTLADGRLVVLSEDLHALIDDDGIVATYDGLAEVAGRGCEGLGIRDLGGGFSRIAVLWEGGYPERGGGNTAWAPRIFVHDVAPEAAGLVIDPDDVVADVRLQMPLPPGREPQAQRFRAPALVWHRLRPGDPDSWGFIVLLSSGSAATPGPGSEEECPKRVDGHPLRWCWKWIQRYDLAGRPVGEPVDLDPFLPEPIRYANWEGMGWFEPGRSLVLVYDESVAERVLDPQEAVIVPLPDGW